MDRIDAERARVAYLNGYSAKELAEQFGCSMSGIHSALKRANTEMRPVGRPKGTQKDVKDQERLAKIVEMREDGATYQEIGDKFGITRERVRQLLRADGHSDLAGCYSHHYVGGPGYEPPKSNFCVDCGERISKTMGTKARPKRCSPCAYKERDPSDAERRERAEKIKAMRLAGKTWQQCAIATGFNNHPSGGGANTYFKRYQHLIEISEDERTIIWPGQGVYKR